jgi:hypothetical protein
MSYRIMGREHLKGRRSFSLLRSVYIWGVGCYA